MLLNIKAFSHIYVEILLLNFSVTGEACYEQNICRPGDNIDKTITDGYHNKQQSADACQSSCQAVNTCNYFSWRRTNKECWLKAKKPEGIENGTDCVSGPKNCPTIGSF